MNISIAMATLTAKTRVLLSKVNSTFGGYALVNGDPSQRFKVANAVNDNEAVNLGQLESIVLSSRSILIGNNGDPFIVGDPTDPSHAVNLGYLTNLLADYASKNGNSNIKFSVANGTDVSDAVSLSQFNNALSGIDGMELGDVVLSTSVILIPGFELWGANNTTKQIADYQELVASGASVVANVNTSAGTFTLLGHNNSSTLGTSVTTTGTPTTTTVTDLNGFSWRSRTAKYIGTTYQYDLNRIEVYDGETLLYGDDPGVSVVNFTGPVIGTDGRQFTRAGDTNLRDYDTTGSRWYYWNATHQVTTTPAPGTSVTKARLKIKLR